MKKIHIGIIAGVIFLGIVTALSISSGNKKHKGVVSERPSLKKAESAFNNGQFLEARVLYQSVMETIEDVAKIKEVQKRIEEINIKIILSPIIDECSAEYIVKYGDALIKIAKKFKTTVGLIKRANNLTSSVIRPNQKLKISTCKFSVAVDKSQNLLFLKRKGEVTKTYIVATGKNNSTPVGTFYIDRSKLIKPTWYKTGAVIPPDSPENILGSRWMGLRADGRENEVEGYGIHGTTRPNELGKQITLGCVRMKNEDVEELFDIIPVGTEVIIVD